MDAHDWNDIQRRLYIFATKLQATQGAPSSWCSPDGVVSEAIEKTYSGQREWKENEVSLLGHLMGAIRSIYSARGKRFRRFRSFLEQNPQASMSAFETAEALERHDFIQKFREALASHDPELAKFFDDANALLSTTCETDTDLQAALKLPKGQVHRNRAKIARFRKKWQGDAELQQGLLERKGHEK